MPIQAATFTCSNAAVTGVCRGLTSGSRDVFLALQREINRVANMYGLKRIDPVDAKIGPQTVTVLKAVVDRLSTQLGSKIDPALDAVLVEVEGSPTTPREIALAADDITNALARGGAPGDALAVLTKYAADVAGKIVGTVPSLIPGLTPAASAAPAVAPAKSPWTDYTPGGAEAAAATANLPMPANLPMWAKLAIGVGAAAGIAGLVVAVFRRR